jgi:hypothetical protein
MFADHTWVPTLPEWVVELQPLLVLAGLLAGVFVLWQMVLQTFEPHKRWNQFRHKPITITATGSPGSEQELAAEIDKALLARHKEEE